MFPVSLQWLCRLLTLVIKYLRMCQYAWMFCEGFYLHKILVTAFKEQKSMLPFYAFGWGKQNTSSYLSILNGYRVTYIEFKHFCFIPYVFLNALHPWSIWDWQLCQPSFWPFTAPWSTAGRTHRSKYSLQRPCLPITYFALTVIFSLAPNKWKVSCESKGFSCT